MLILASRSPRRVELLKRITPDFITEPSGFDEDSVRCHTPEQLVRTLAWKKASVVVKRHPEAVVIGCDTVVVAPNGEIFGIPKDSPDAVRMLQTLSGKTHKVITGGCVIGNHKKTPFHKTAKVTFETLSEADIAWYLSTGEPFDKAGAYGIQGYASVFVTKINGDFNTVVGMPLQTLRRILQKYKY